jgi:hypothetical protein
MPFFNNCYDHDEPLRGLHIRITHIFEQIATKERKLEFIEEIKKLQDVEEDTITYMKLSVVIDTLEGQSKPHFKPKKKKYKRILVDDDEDDQGEQ